MSRWRKRVKVEFPCRVCMHWWNRNVPYSVWRLSKLDARTMQRHNTWAVHQLQTPQPELFSCHQCSNYSEDTFNCTAAESH